MTCNKTISFANIPSEMLYVNGVRVTGLQIRMSGDNCCTISNTVDIVVPSNPSEVIFRCEYDGLRIPTDYTNPTYCNDDTRIYQLPLPKINYIYPYTEEPLPLNVYNLICDEVTVNLSKKIKITIPDDPIFSGIYVFDHSPGNGDSDLFSDNWILNSGESSHSLSAYDHSLNAPGDPPSHHAKFQNKILVSLNDYSYSDHPEYLELKTSYHSDINNDAAHQIDDAYAFPAHFVFTAVQSSCPCAGQDYFNNLITTEPSGHRLSVGFAPPIRWRRPYQDWIIVDQIPHIINTEFAGGGNTIPNYVSGVPFNNGISHFDSISQTNIFPNNSIYLTYGTSYVPGQTVQTIKGPGIYDLSGSAEDLNFFVNCTGIEDLGFAFRVSSISGGVAITGNIPGTDAGTIIPGIGRHHIFTKDFDFSLNLSQVDKSNFFGPKIPVQASIRFTYSCRPLLPCQNGVGENIPITKHEASGCGYYLRPVIGVDQLCGGQAQPSPPDSHWIDNNITSTQIIYSGARSGLLPIIISGEYPNHIDFSLRNNFNVIKEWDWNTHYYDAYITNSTNPGIIITHTGVYPSEIRAFLLDSLRPQMFDAAGIMTHTSPSEELDLYWNVNYSNNTARVYVIPTDSDFGTLTSIIDIVGAGTTSVNGRYLHNHSNQIQGESVYINSSNFKIRSVTKTKDDETMYWVLGKDTAEGWRTYYSTSGNLLSPNLISQDITTNNNWITEICSSGLAPAPLSRSRSSLYLKL